MDAKVLRARALALLAQREYSRMELRRKLLRLVQTRRAAELQNAEEQGWAAEAGGDAEAGQQLAAVEAVLDALELAGWQSDQRAAESRLRTGASRSGVRKLAADLQQRGLSPTGEIWAQLQATEADRARALLHKRFGTTAPVDRADWARRVRFLVYRGFDAALASRLCREAPDSDPS
ncbi:regulatory protein RecX [Inhella gelatinilytica]|uniref:Regulatory protein RecX n=1 Tax=Inhella gelatinilytica TaxID=2795030 RepID=A0A931NCC0_9BURK|nr:regulatory protein RecX [Inhella gelatinilytica]MBH9551837.1 regulatory protein RecX [Inhella gelatinilytica]